MRSAALFPSSLVMLFALTAHAQSMETDPTSEEYAPAECSDTTGIVDTGDVASVGAHCTGKYCDNVSLLCDFLPGDMELVRSSKHWTPWFSEEDAQILLNEQQCPEDDAGMQVVVGLKCRGKYCDDVSLQCARVVRRVGAKTFGVFRGRCHLSPWISEESPNRFEAPTDQYVVGVECLGSYCDEMRYRYCEIEE